MFNVKHIALALAFLCSGALCAGTRPPAKPQGHQKGIRISGGPVAGFYELSRNHAKGLTSPLGGIFSYKKEIRFGRDFKTFFLYGLEYFVHGYNFQSYYFKQDTFKLYDKNNMTFRYSVVLQEINVPFNVKYAFKRENNSQYSHYAIIGYNFRYLLPASVKVRENGNLVRTDNPQMKFKNYLLSEQINAYLTFGIGWQKNNTASSKAGIFIEANYRYGFSPYYFQTRYSASAVYVSSSHIAVVVGVKF